MPNTGDISDDILGINAMLMDTDDEDDLEEEAEVDQEQDGSSSEVHITLRGGMANHGNLGYLFSGWICIYVLGFGGVAFMLLL